VLLMCYMYEPPYQSGVCLDRIPSCWPYLVLKFIVYCGDDGNDDDDDDDDVAKSAAVVTATVIVVTIVIHVAHAYASSCLSVLPAAWNNSAPTGRIFTKFNV